jgi:hypothetical protein
VVMLTSLLTDETLMTSYGGSIDRNTLCDRLWERMPSVGAY